jgi:hypothetical protein
MVLLLQRLRLAILATLIPLEISRNVVSSLFVNFALSRLLGCSGQRVGKECVSAKYVNSSYSVVSVKI